MASFADTFNRANGAVGGNWTAVNGGVWNINANALVQTNTMGAYRALRWNGGAFDSANLYARVTARAASGVGFGVIVRCPTTGTTSTAIDGYAIVGFVDDQWYRIEFADGNDAGFIGLGGVVAPNTDYTIETRANGTTITLFVNGAQVAEWTDATYTTGGAMLVTFGGAVTFDAFEAADLVNAISLTAQATATSATTDGLAVPVGRAGSMAVQGTSQTADAASLTTATVLSVTLGALAASVTDDGVTALLLARAGMAAAALSGTREGAALRLDAAQALAVQARSRTSVREGVRFFGNGSGQIDRLRIALDAPADPPIDVGAGDFCYEFWMRCAFADNATTATDEDARYSNIILDRDIWAHERGWVLGVTRNAASTALVACFGAAGAGLSWTTLYGASNVGDGRWHHLALSRSGSTVRLFVDGAQEAAGAYGGDLSYPNGVRPSSGQDNPYLVIGTEKHDVGFGYSGDFAAFRVSDSARYTAPFTPPQTLALDGDTAALFLFAEQAGAAALDAAFGQSAALLVGGTPSGPVWVAGGSAELVIATGAFIQLTATAASSTAGSVVASILRPLIASTPAVSVTADTAPAALLRSFSTAVLLSSVDAISSLTMHRSLAISGSPSTGAQTAALALLRRLTGSPQSGTGTGVTLLALLRPASLSPVGVTTTQAQTALNVLRRLTQGVGAASGAAAVTVNLSAIVQALLAATGQTATGQAQASVARTLAAQVGGQTQTGGVSLTLAVILQALLAAIGQTATGQAQAAIVRAGTVQAQGGTATGEAQVALAAWLAAAAAAQTETGALAAAVARTLAVQADAATATGPVEGAVARTLAAQAGGQSDAASALVAVRRALLHGALSGTETGQIAIRGEAIVGLLQLIVGQARRPSIAASARRPSIHSM